MKTATSTANCLSGKRETNDLLGLKSNAIIQPPLETKSIHNSLNNEARKEEAIDSAPHKRIPPRYLSTGIHSDVRANISLSLKFFMASRFDKQSVLNKL